MFLDINALVIVCQMIYFGQIFNTTLAFQDMQAELVGCLRRELEAERAEQAR